MYIEEMVIDDYLQRMDQWEHMDEEAQWENSRPVAPDIVSYYEERGELWSDQEHIEEQEIAPDILG